MPILPLFHQQENEHWRVNMQKLLGLAIILILILVATANRGLEAKDKDDIIQLKAEILVLQKQVRDLQESADKNTGQVTTLLNQVVDNIAVTRRDTSQTRESVSRSLSDLVGNTSSTTQQVTQLHERLNATDSRIERVEAQVKEIKNFFTRTDITTNCEDPEKQYGQAYSDYLRANYALAIEQFRNYVRCFAKTESAGMAQYLIGDAYYKMLEFKSAIPELDKFLTEYPTNPRAVTARFKKADALLKTDQRKEAEEVFSLLIQTNPNSTEALQARKILDQLPPLPEEKPPTPTPPVAPPRTRRR
jgi:TolA-binding protein